MKFLLSSAAITAILAGNTDAFAFVNTQRHRSAGTAGTVALEAKKVSFKENARTGLVSGINKVSRLVIQIDERFGPGPRCSVLRVAL